MKHFCLLLALFFLISCKAQLPPGEYSSTNKKAIAAFEGAINLFQQRKNDKAKEELLKAIEKDPFFIEPHLLLAQIHEEERNIEKSIDEYVRAITINPTFNLNNYFNLARLEIKIGRYEDAKKDFESFLKKPNINPDSRDVAIQSLKNCDFAINAIKNPVPFDPKNMGPAVNSNFWEYFPAITADDQTFIFTRNMRQTMGEEVQEDFMISNNVGGEWQPAVPLASNINSAENEGAPTLSADGQLLFFTVCPKFRSNTYGHGRNGYGACDIFYTEKVGSQWAKPYNLGPAVNSQYRETQPAFSADGKSLYFVSNRPGGFGEHDIYVSKLNDNGSWSRPINLGKNVNSEGDEESVFIHADGKTLYFGSNGHTGMGGLDIFISHMDEKGNWGPAQNIGYPINTFNDEHSLLVNGRGDLAYFASDREGSLGGTDIYKFELYDKIRPGKITYVKGKVYDAETKKPLAAHFELIDLASETIVVSSDANSGNGEFLVTLPLEKDYALNVSYPGYLFHSETFSLKKSSDITKPFQLNVPLLAIDTGAVVELKNVFFETGKFDLKPESKAELNKLTAFLNSNKAIKGELSGHTDNVGDKKMNQILSENRAKAVYNFLVAAGIDASRLSYRGYGDTRPKVKNDSDLNRSINRRTEFKIKGK